MKEKLVIKPNVARLKEPEGKTGRSLLSSDGKGVLIEELPLSNVPELEDGAPEGSSNPPEEREPGLVRPGHSGRGPVSRIDLMFTDFCKRGVSGDVAASAETAESNIS
ncbi:hypothetical protein EYF80_036106 [Liparis tanakae]|uniref:Uncharacterized protein n=1 Tax=Liparis tanakae TaxID=230148 RepID=A0A4Z2GKC8_9TELE|nr:hypothetical protein EYF80_036106 [Liparis tanakae]